MADVKLMTAHEKNHIQAAMAMLLQSTRRAQKQMRDSNREAVADAIGRELALIMETAQKIERVL